MNHKSLTRDVILSQKYSVHFLTLFRSVIHVVYLRTKYTNTYRKGSQKHNYICNIQSVSVYTNVSANCMFRPLLVRPYSGWIPWSEEMYTRPIFVNEISSPLNSMVVLHYCTFPLTKVSNLKMA